MKYRAILAVFGIFFIILQILAFIGISRSYDSLYSCKTTLFVYTETKNTHLTFKQATFAITAGSDRFWSSIQDLQRSEDEYIPPSANHYASMYIREDLGCCAGGSFGLFIYDVILTISFCFSGIIGIALLLCAGLLKRKSE